MKFSGEAADLGVGGEQVPSGLAELGDLAGEQDGAAGVRALRPLRLSRGAGPGGPLVTAETAGISALLRDARRDLGLRLANRLVSGDERNVRFRGQLGLHLHDMRQNRDLA